MKDLAASLHVLDDSDDVGVVVVDTEEVPRGHKVAVRQVPKGAPVHKYGHVIGYATQDIAPGEHVHTHNLEFGGRIEVSESQADESHEWQNVLPVSDRGTFMGFRRSNGKVATRNVIGIVSTVNCSATVCQQIASMAMMSGLVDEYPNIDAVVPVTHSSGCGLSSSGENLERLRRTLAGYAGHVNVGALVVVSLGCEVNRMLDFMNYIDRREDLPIVQMTMQELGGTQKTVQAGLAAVREAAEKISNQRREEFPVSELRLGLNCGGSDGWSGITANPALGVASDMLVARGGRSVLAETPEVYGAEDLLLSRATSPEIKNKFNSIIETWEESMAQAGDSLDNNPSPGNKAGGLTTILEKSLGAAAKGGHAPLEAVYEYAEEISTPGFGFMDTPGYDPVSVTGLIAGGANVVVFTTGRGSALGYSLVPVIKVSTNSALFRQMPDDMDLDAGDIVEKGTSLSQKGQEIYELIVDVASGQKTCSEGLGYGTQEFIPWLQGPVL